MKTIPLLLAMIVMSGASVLGQWKPKPPSQQPTTPVMQRGRQVLFDFRKDQRPTQSPRISSATQRQVLSKVFRRYLTDENRCNRDFASSDDDQLAAARKAGQIAPSIEDAVNGSFTAPGQTQTAYLIWVRECNASHADAYGTRRVAIFSGQQLVADLDAEFKGSALRKTDLDSDGVDELLMTGGDMNQGTLIEIASLVEFRNGRMRVIEDLGTVVEDSCASGFQGSSSKASVISFSDVEPGKMPKLRIDNYQSPCRNVKRWRLIGTGKMQ